MAQLYRAGTACSYMTSQPVGAVIAVTNWRWSCWSR